MIALADYDEEKDMDMVATFLKKHPESTIDEIMSGTGINRSQVFYCLKMLQARGTVTVIETKPQRWVLR